MKTTSQLIKELFGVPAAVERGTLVTTLPKVSPQTIKARNALVNPDLRHSLVEALRRSGRFTDVKAQADTRSNPAKVYLQVRCGVGVDVVKLVTELADKAGFNLAITRTSQDGPIRRFRVTSLSRKANRPTPDLFSAMQAAQSNLCKEVILPVVHQPQAIQHGVTIDGRTYNVSRETKQAILKLIRPDVTLTVVNAQNLAVVNIKVPAEVDDGIQARRPLTYNANGIVFNVSHVNGLTVIKVSGKVTGVYLIR